MTFGRMTPVGPPAADHALLARFADEQDEPSFTELVRRHGPSVFGVCRRMLGHRQDAEDAAQAVFVVLARNASGIRQRQSIAAWLYGVAVRVCRKARSRRKPTTPITSDPAIEPSWQDGLRAVDDALAHLPESLRQPVVLCYLHGLTRDEAAVELGLSESTLRGRLDRGKERLRRELERRGLSLAVGLIAAGVTAQPLSAAVTLSLRDAATGAVPLTESVRSLTTGVLPMSPWKFWITGALAVGLLVAGGVGWLGFPPTPSAQADTFSHLAKPDPKAGKAEAKLNGEWASSNEANGGKTKRDIRLKFLDGQHLIWELTHTQHNLAGPQVITMKMKYEITKEGELKVEVLEKWHGEDKMAKLPESDLKPRMYSMTWDQAGKSFTLKAVPASESPWATMEFARGGEKPKSVDPLVPESLTKIDRTITKLPPLSTDLGSATTAQVQPKSPAPDQPGYCLLAFGPKADFRAWVILDGEKLYVDRNGNGDLTDDKPVTAERVIRGRNERFFNVDNIGSEKEEKKWTLSVSIVPVGASQPGAVFVVTRAGSPYQKVGPTDFRFTDTPDTARVVHFGSSVLAARPSLTMPSLLTEGEKVDFRVQVGTPGVGAGSFASVSNDGLNKSTNPVAEFAFQPAKPGDKPVVVKVELKERCCGDQFYAAVEVPKETTGNRATVTVHYPAYPHGAVAPFIGQVPVVRKE